jgi:hypothetical protein
MLSLERRRELEKEISVFQESSVSINWYSTENRSTAIMEFQCLSINCDNGYICIGEDCDNPSLYIDTESVNVFNKEMDRLKIETVGMNYIIEVA